MGAKIAGPADWLAVNRANWDARVPIHAESKVYDIPAFVAGHDTLRDYEPGEVGDVRGKTLLHLQCHLGLDTLSWARRGATVTVWTSRSRRWMSRPRSPCRSVSSPPVSCWRMSTTR